jgi:hypothetical protein
MNESTSLPVKVQKNGRQSVSLDSNFFSIDNDGSAMSADGGNGDDEKEKAEKEVEQGELVTDVQQEVAILLLAILEGYPEGNSTAPGRAILGSVNPRYSV